MGTCCSKSNCHNICTCFLNDNNVDNISAKRLYILKWMWTDHHQNALFNTVYYTYGIPTVISYIIKHYAATDTQDYHITSTRLCIEKYYKNHTTLLNKRLCTTWFSQYSSIISQITMVIIGKNLMIKEKSISAFKNKECLPALKQTYFAQDLTMNRRTIFIDGCQITVTLRTMNCIKSIVDIQGIVIYLITIDQSDFIDHVNKICTINWNKNRSMNNCILVRNKQTANKYKKEDIMLSQKWNIGYFVLDYKRENL
eukprot:475518_1